MRRIVPMALALFVCLTAFAEDAFYSVPLTDLKFDSGTLPAPAENNDWRNWRTRAWTQPRAVVTSGQAIVRGSRRGSAPWSAAVESGDRRLLVRAPAGQDVAGTLFVEKTDGDGMVALNFSIPQSKATPEAREEFFTELAAHYQSMVDLGVPGAAYFRYLANEARGSLGKDARTVEQARRPGWQGEVDDSFSLFTGGRAISENLQLDRGLVVDDNGSPTVPVDTITGISVAEIDWKPLIGDAKPATDPLAAMIPGDQYAIFFPSFDAARTLIETADRYGTPVISLMDQRTQDMSVQARYERQTGLSMGALAKLLGPALVDAVAVTGGDPYVRVGTDIAVLFQTRDANALKSLLVAKLATSGIPPKQETIEGLDATVFRTADRSVCSYIVGMDGAVLVTNSPAQVRAIGRTRAKSIAALATAPEYTFFRARYERGASDETAFVILTDAAIRKWCSARWRIADSRRTRAAAILSDLQARYATQLVSGRIESGAIHTTFTHPNLGDLKLTSAGVWSSVYGSLDFMTPISELEFDKVTEVEDKTYQRWRDQYQSYWRGAFDPIAARLTINDSKLGLDLTVMPLIVSSDYRSIVELTHGAAILPDSADPHGAPLHLVLAINPKSGLMRSANTMAIAFAPKAGVEPLAWVGPTVSIFADDDPFWNELAGKSQADADKFLREKGYSLPVGVYIESNSALKLTAFLAAARAFIEQTAPDMTQWETVKHGDVSYVKITPSERARAEQREIDRFALYYAVSGKGLLISPNEQVITRALDRAAGKLADASPTTRPWLGESGAAQLDLTKLRAIEKWFGAVGFQMDDEARRLSWMNIPILNEWKQLFPDRDPLAVHKQLWGVQLLDPAGGAYEWNEQFKTMQSSTYGCPESPRTGPPIPSPIEGFDYVNAGLTFENNGLRARVQVDRAASK